jgi:hypothetical protein
MEIAKASDFTSGSRFWTDPQKMPPKAPPPPDPLIVQAQIKAQADTQKHQMDAQTEQAKLQQQELESQRNVTLQKYIADQRAQVELLVNQATAEHQKFLEQVKGEHAAGLAAISAALDPKTTEAKTGSDTAKQHGDLIQHVMKAHADHAEQMKGMMTEMVGHLQKLSGPKKAIRGKDGKIEQVVPA